MSDPAPETTHQGGVPPGRPVRLEPTPPGLWRVLLGIGVAALAPLFGFLIGGSAGMTDDRANDPKFLALSIGIMVGGVGVLVAITGGMRLWRHFRDQRLAEEADTDAVPQRRAT